jgi:hypothetical protein
MTLSFLSSHYIQRARFGSLSPFVKPYIALVLNEGYEPTTIVGQLRLIARLNRWLLRTGHELRGLDERILDQFRRCEQKKRLTPAAGNRVTLQRLPGLLREARVAPLAEESVPQTAVRCLTERYQRHLFDDQGLAESTMTNYTWHVQKFLSEQFHVGDVHLSSPFRPSTQLPSFGILRAITVPGMRNCSWPPCVRFFGSYITKGDGDGFCSGFAQCGKLGIV